MRFIKEFQRVTAQREDRSYWNYGILDQGLRLPQTNKVEEKLELLLLLEIQLLQESGLDKGRRRHPVQL